MSVAAATARPAARVAPSRARPQLGLELAAFFSLAAFVAVRYAALIATPPTLRVVLVAAYATLGCGLLAATGRLTAPRPAVTVLRLAIVLGTFAISVLALRVPAHLLAPGQWNHLAHRLSGGVDEISGWLWPYRGGDRWAQAAVLLPIPAILLAAGCTSFWPSPAMLATRRVLAVAALLAVFVAGTANAPSPLPTLDGVVLAALVAATLLLPFASGSETGRALCWLAVCGAAALTAQSALSSSNPWIHYRDAAASPLSATFQWDQMYGPDRWPRSQASMLEVSEPNPTLLRVTSLDRFDGLRFLRSPDPPGSLSADFPRANLQRWTDRASIEVRGLRSSMLASGGGLPESVRWLNDIAPPLAWQPDRTAESTAVPARGNAYVVSFYEPRPSPKEAAAAPRTYPRAYLPYVLFALPSTGATALGTASVQPDIRLGGPSAEVVGPSAPGRTPASNPRTAALIEASPYAPMFALARRLAAGASSNYEVATRITRYLRSNYTYDRQVPLTRYPLESFLFSQRRGYCQQFSGAMTLMLRMDGIPARVGVGFRPVARGEHADTWSARTVDAHAWVEVFLSGIGWVTFDPTPPTSTPAAIAEATALSRAAVFGGATTAHGHGTLAVKAAGPVASTSSHSAWWPFAALAAGLAGLLALAVRLRVRAVSQRGAAEEQAVAELQRALSRLGRARPGLTLAQLEGGLEREGRQAAAGYVREIRARRFGSERAARPVRGRSALRRALAASHGLGGWVRAMRALPPAWGRR